MKGIGIAITGRGAAIVTVDRGEDDSLVVTGIERLPFHVATVAARVRELKEPKANYTIDAAGQGKALWEVLQDDHDSRWTLFEGRGIARQALVDALVVADAQDRLRFAAELPEQEAMTRALASYKREVGEDGVIGGELVVALCLAVLPPPPRVEFIPFD
jgi:hypothetical protein